MKKPVLLAVILAVILGVGGGILAPPASAATVHEFIDRAKCPAPITTKRELLHALDACLRVDHEWFTTVVNSQMAERGRARDYANLRQIIWSDAFVLMPCQDSVRNLGWEGSTHRPVAVLVPRSCKPHEMMLVYMQAGAPPVAVISADCLNPQVVPPLQLVYQPGISSMTYISKAGFPGIMFHDDSQVIENRPLFGSPGRTFTGAVPILD